MTVNTATLNLITEFEGLRLEAYADPAHGWKVPTIGVGHTSAAGPPKVFKGQKITKAEAQQILARDLAAVEATVKSAVKVPLNENQFGALVSFTFNLGGTNLRKSTLLKKLNAKDYAGTAAQFGRWNRADGKVLAGLTRRREAERVLFLAPVKKAAPAKAVAKAEPIPEEPKVEEFEEALAPEPVREKRTIAGWLNGLVTSTAAKYVVAMIATYVAQKLGLDKGSVEGLLSQAIGVLMAAWGMWEASRNKVVVDGDRTSIPPGAKHEVNAAVKDIVAKSLAEN